MSQDGKKYSADEIIKRSVELFGLTPNEISDRNVEWMRKKGFKNLQSDDHERQSFKPSARAQSDLKNSRVSSILKRLGIQRSF